MHLLMTAPCLLGLEGLVADELRFMEAENVLAENGRVFFEGDEAMLARILRIIKRVVCMEY